MMSYIYKELSNLSYVGGLLLTNFIIGFNYKTNEFVYTAKDLSNLNVFEIKGPLLNTSMYIKFIQNGNVPLVIKAIYFHDAIRNEYNRFNIGKFGSQKSYSNFVYGNQYITMLKLNDKKYYNIFFTMYPRIIIEYFYFDGIKWVFDIEYIGGNTPDWFVTYTDNMDNSYYQHKFEYPLILLPYFKKYSISEY